jgi:hypothetical protein
LGFLPDFKNTKLLLDFCYSNAEIMQGEADTTSTKMTSKDEH